MAPEELDDLLAEVDALAGGHGDELPIDRRRRVVEVTATRIAEGYEGRELRRVVRGDLSRDAGFLGTAGWIFLAIRILVPLVQLVIERRRRRRAA